jgi:microcystin-dependent protein
MWSGTTPPIGWALCNGQADNGHTTPDLRGRFIVGYDASDADYNSIEKMGGEKEHMLTIEEMPRHDHTTHGKPTIGKSSDPPIYLSISNPNYNSYSGGGAAWFGSGSSADNNMRTGDTGGNSSGSIGDAIPHENRPPYYVLAFIMRVQ